MTLDKQHGDYVVECDDCNELLETKQADFQAMRNMMTRQGWIARKHGERWQHYCPDCAETRR